MEEKPIGETENITTEIEEVTSSSGSTGSTGSSGSTESSSKDEQPYKKSIAETVNQEAQPTLSMKEFKAMKRSGYDKIVEKFPMAYVLQNIKTGMIVQIQAASSYHACNIIGWRPRHVRLLEVIDTKKKENVEEEEKKDVEVSIVETTST